VEEDEEILSHNRSEAEIGDHPYIRSQISQMSTDKSFGSEAFTENQIDRSSKNSKSNIF
jgi:hypothetical protein